MFMVFGVITVLISRSFNLGLKINHPPFNGLGVVSPDLILFCTGCCFHCEEQLAEVFGHGKSPLYTTIVGILIMNIVLTFHLACLSCNICLIATERCTILCRSV